MGVTNSHNMKNCYLGSRNFFVQSLLSLREKPFNFQQWSNQDSELKNIRNKNKTLIVFKLLQNFMVLPKGPKGVTITNSDYKHDHVVNHNGRQTAVIGM